MKNINSTSPLFPIFSFFIKKERVPVKNNLTNSILLIITMLMMGNSSWAQAPTIDFFNTDRGAPGTLFTITGYNLSNSTAIKIGGVTGSAIVISTTITKLVGMVMPGAATGTVAVTTSGGTATSSGTFTVLNTSYPIVQQGTKLTASNDVLTPGKGWSVALSADGTTALVGGYYDNNGVGASWVYTRSGNTWTQQQKLIGTGAGVNAWQGFSVALSADGNTAIVGGVIDNSAWVFTRSGATWAQQGPKLVGSDRVGNAWFGKSVSLSADGSTALVGGYQDTTNVGAAWVFTRSGSTWAQQGTKLVGTGAVGAAGQGHSVSLSADGNIAAIGGAYDDSQKGATWIFTRSGNTWVHQKIVVPGVGAAKQGQAVALSADATTLIIGGVNATSNVSNAWVFTRSGTTWTQQGSTIAGLDGVGTAANGTSVSLSADGNTAMMGSVSDNGNKGAAWVFTRSGNTYTQQGNKLAATGAGGTTLYMGRSVAISADGKNALVGADGDNTNQGAVWSYCRGITYDGNGNTGGTVPSSTLETTSLSVTVSTNTGTLVKTGYTFAGWNTLADGTGTSYSSGASIEFNGSLQLYAQWTPNNYTVSFNADGGSGTMANQTIAYLAAANLKSNEFYRSGYTFAGWATTSGGLVGYANAASYTMSTAANVTLYAQWTQNSYTITFNANSGTGTMANQTVAYLVSANLTANAFTRTGYTFIGWSDGSGPFIADMASYTLGVAANITIYANWSVNNYNITFNGNGSTAGSMAVQSIPYSDWALIAVNTFTRNGYTFAGWNTAPDGTGTSYVSGNQYYMGAADVTLYAKWTPNNYEVRFNPNGGIGSMSNQAIAFNAVANLTSNIYTRAGYTFVGWATTSGGTVAYANGASYTMSATANVTLYAQWNCNTDVSTSSSPTLCINTVLSNITHTTTGATGIATATGLPTGVIATWVNNTITISGTPTASGTFNYSIPLTGGCGSVNAIGTITVLANTVGAASSTPTLCINTLLTNITHTTTGANDIGTATGLPAGVSVAFANNTITISGTATTAGTFNYSIPLTGGCGSVNATGTITVTANTTVSTASSTPIFCINTPLTNIMRITSGANGIGTPTGLPEGVGASWVNNTITISGTPIASGTFNYSIPLTGGCGTLNATGIITVREFNGAEINLQGNALDIVSGAISPSLTDGTEFGIIVLNTPTAKTFTIQNTGVSNLSVATIMLSGADASSFILGGITLPATIAAGASTTFTVTLNATTLNSKLAVVTINNDDCDESVYSFMIQSSDNYITFDSNGGLREMSNQLISYNTSATLTANAFYRLGYSFAGWGTTREGEVVYADGANYTMNTHDAVVLYAKWTYSYIGGHFQIFARRSDSMPRYANSVTTLTLDCDSSDSIENVKQKIIDRTSSVPIGNLVIGFNGTTLEDGRTLADYYIAREYTIHFFAVNLYPATSVLLGGTTSVLSVAAPGADYTNRTVSTTADFTGTLSILPSGEVSIENASPAGTYLIQINNGYGSEFQRFNLTVYNNSYTVLFDANGGTGRMAVQPIDANTSANLITNTFTRTGYTFSGWNTAANGSGISYFDGSSYTMSAAPNVTLYAQWLAINYTITFDANGGTGTMSDQTLAFNASANLTSNAFTRWGYTFTGWNVNGNSYANQASYTMSAAANVTLQAQWQPLQTPGTAYQIFVRQSDSMPRYVGGIGTTIAVDVDGDNTIGQIRQYLADLTLVPVGNLVLFFAGRILEDGYILADYNIERESTIHVSAVHLYPATSVTVGGNTSVLSVAAPGAIYTNKTVSTTSDFTGTLSLLPSGEVSIQNASPVGTYVVQVTNDFYGGSEFQRFNLTVNNNYTVTFNANGGTGTMTSQSIAYLASTNLMTNAFTRTGYTFAGWAITSTGTVAYANGASYTMSAAANVTLFAQWDCNTAVSTSNTPTLCVNTPLTNITHTTTSATGIGTAIGLPAGVSAAFANNIINISGTPTASGIFNYSIPLTGGCGSVNATGTINVIANNTVGAASSTPTLCVNTPLTNIIHNTTVATGIETAIGLPTGVTAAWASNTIIISGTPVQSGIFNYSIPLTGCGNVNATGTITVNVNEVSAASSTPTLCISTALTNIIHTTSGATGIGTAIDLPSGVTAAWANNTITISGTPAESGIFNYSIPLTGGCDNVSAVGTITIINPVSTASSTPTLCINTVLTNITHTTTDATGIGTPIGFPAGVYVARGNGVITISGTPRAAGTFNYSIPIIGSCGTVSATGTITVTPTNTVGGPSSAPTLCINTALSAITLTTTGATGIGTATGLPAGVSAAFANDTITISGTPTASGTFNYSIPLTGGCSTVIATGTITVNANNTVGTASITPTLVIKTTLTNNITHSTTVATGIGTATGLPTGVTAAWATNTITISGTPTVLGTFNYSIPLIGGCGSDNAIGTITVTPNNTIGNAYVPQKMTYQWVLRSSNNALITNTVVGTQISVLQGNASGPAVYVETQAAVANANGLVSVAIGSGTATMGTFAGIDWASGPYFIKTETDLAGGSNYTITGTQEMLSVPYALYAAHSNDAGPQGPIGLPGATGPQGPIGLTGATGASGVNGAVGGFTHYIGEVFNGGIIYYLYRGSDGLEHGLIVSLTESSTGLAWQTVGTLVNANSFEDGAYNTALMTNSPAADYIASLGEGWYLASSSELNKLFQNRFHVNKALSNSGSTLLSTNYWSSTSTNTSQAINQTQNYFLITSGGNNYLSKTSPFKVRGIRSF